MKVRFRKLFCQLIVLVVCANGFASNLSIPDTTFNNKTHIDTSKVKPILFINFSTGLFINKTFGYHPLFNLYFKYRYEKNYFKLIYEHRFRDSKNDYSILDNDSLKYTNVFRSEFIGLEYERPFFRNSNHDLYIDFGFGYDWIEILKDKKISNYKLISGWAFNIGFGYTFYIRKKHGPNVELLYHIGKLDNKGGENLNNNSMEIRLNYYFSNLN